jgi:hypothetical protein
LSRLSSIVGDLRAPTQHAVFIRITVTGAQRTVVFARPSPTLPSGVVKAPDEAPADTHTHTNEDTSNNSKSSDHSNGSANPTAANERNGRKVNPLPDPINNNNPSVGIRTKTSSRMGNQSTAATAWRYELDDLVSFPVKDRDLTMVTFELMEVLASSSHHRVLAARTCLLLDLVHQPNSSATSDQPEQQDDDLHSRGVGLRQVLLFVPGQQRAVCTLHLQVTLVQPRHMTRSRSLGHLAVPTANTLGPKTTGLAPISPAALGSSSGSEQGPAERLPGLRPIVSTHVCGSTRGDGISSSVEDGQWLPVVQLGDGQAGMVELVILAGEPFMRTGQGQQLDRHAYKAKGRTYMQEWSAVRKQVVPAAVMARFMSPPSADAAAATAPAAATGTDGDVGAAVAGLAVPPTVPAAPASAAVAAAAEVSNGTATVNGGDEVPKVLLMDPYVILKVFGHPSE